MSNALATLARYALTALIWVGVFVFVGFLVNGNSNIESSHAMIVGGIAFIAATMTTGIIIVESAKSRASDADKSAQAETNSAKRKNDAGGLDPMSLLTEEDIAELREDIKRSLRLKLLSGQDGELSSLDALLAEQEQPSKHR